MKRLIFSALLVGCSSASSSGGSIAPGQVDPGEPTAPDETAPSATLPPSTSGSRPPSGETPRGCPMTRVDGLSPTWLSNPAEVRTMLAGIYRDCAGTSGLELRLDPDSDTRLLFWSLDDRFVRLTTPATSGWIDIVSCGSPRCSVVYHVDGVGDQNDTTKEMTVWSDPIAVRLVSSVAGSSAWVEWVRVSN